MRCIFPSTVVNYSDEVLLHIHDTRKADVHHWLSLGKERQAAQARQDVKVLSREIKHRNLPIPA